MNDFEPHVIFAIAFGLMTDRVVKTFFEQNPVQSDIISMNELIDTTSVMLGGMIWARLNGMTNEEIAEHYADQIAFIKSITTPF